MRRLGVRLRSAADGWRGAMLAHPPHCVANRAKAQPEHEQHRLAHDSAGHLRAPRDPLAEHDRHLDDAGPPAMGPPRRLDLEAVARRRRLTKPDRVEELAA